nr:immunoglobulin heavy chain junction region [Mus musculus]
CARDDYDVMDYW